MTAQTEARTTPPVSPQRAVLRDPALEEEFQRRGYVTVPLLSPGEVARLYDFYTERAGEEGPNPPGAYNDTYAEFSVIHSRPDFRAEAYDIITEVVTPHAQEHLVDYRPLLGNFVNKPAGTGVVPAHQNWSVVDEHHFQSVSVWVALVDCVVENGAMLMLDGSHRDFREPRGMWTYETFNGLEDLLVREYLTPVCAKAGEAVILDDALVHYSPPNRTAQRRLAIQHVMVPEVAESLFYQQIGEHDDQLEVDVWKVEPAFFFDFWHGDGDTNHATKLERVDIPKPDHDEGAIRRLYQPTTPPTAGPEDLVTASAADPPKATGSAAAVPPAAPTSVSLLSRLRRRLSGRR